MSNFGENAEFGGKSKKKKHMFLPLFVQNGLKIDKKYEN